MNTTGFDESSLNMSKASEEDWGADLDPMLEGGFYKVVFSRQCPFEIRRIDEEGHQYGMRDMLSVRIMASPSMQNCSDIKIEISSETDLYMVFECRMDEKKFERIKKQQSFNFNFENFISMLIKLLGYCDKSPQQYTTVLYQGKTAGHRMIILENMQYKKIELLALEFVEIDQEFNKQYLSFRFSILKAKNQKLISTTKDMLGLVKLKNKNLLEFMAKKTSDTNLGIQAMLGNTSTSSINIGFHKPGYR